MTQQTIIRQARHVGHLSDMSDMSRTKRNKGDLTKKSVKASLPAVVSIANYLIINDARKRLTPMSDSPTNVRHAPHTRASNPQTTAVRERTKR